MADRDYTRDLDDDEDLDQEETSPVEFWASKQKELVTSVVDYNLSTLVDLIGSDAIDLDPKFQRRLRWDQKRQSRLIESFLMNVPVPPIFLNEDDYGKFSVIDGKQRLNAISTFLNNNLELQGLEVFSDINGSRFSDLPTKLRNIIRTRPTVRAVIILRQSDSDIKNEVFHRLNTGGARLNPQEIRNNAYHGKLNNMIMHLSESKEFHRALNIKSKQKSAIYQEMRDAELILRYFTFYENWNSFTGGIRRAMDNYMRDNRNPSRSRIIELQDSFTTTLESVVAVFDDHAFQRWMPEKGSAGDWRRHALASLFDAQMFGLQGYAPDELRPHKEIIIRRFKRLFSDQDFRKSIDAATNTPSLFKERIRTVRSLVADIVR